MAGPAILGIDVHSGLGRIDWPAVAASGVRYGLARCIRSTGQVDTRYRENVAGMRAHGILPGAYGFPVHGAAGPAAADLAREIGDPAGVIVGVDVELGNVTRTDLNDWRAAWRAVHPDHVTLVYTGPHLWVSGTPGPPYGPLWAAGSAPDRYTTATGGLEHQWQNTTVHYPPFAGWQEPAMVQFTDHAIIPGIGGNTDGNAWLGTLEQLLELAGEPMAITVADADLIVDRWLARHVATGWQENGTFDPDPLNADHPTLGQISTETRRVFALLPPEDLAAKVAAAVVAALPGSGAGITPAEVAAACEAAVRRVLGSLG